MLSLLGGIVQAERERESALCVVFISLPSAQLTQTIPSSVVVSPSAGLGLRVVPGYWQRIMEALEAYCQFTNS